MSVNSSSCHNASHPPPLTSSDVSVFICFGSRTGSVIFSAFAATNILLLLPLSILVLYVGFQRWRQQRSSSRTATSHADLFTYHMVAIEVFGLMGCGFYISGHYMGNQPTMILGFSLVSQILPGQTFFHCLTCMERHLAVVHPVTYLGLRSRGGVRIRNISIVCVWLLSVGWMGLMYVYFPFFPTIPFFSLCTISLFVSSFCSLSVLRALTRPLPGEGGGDRERVNQSKQKAFHTVTVIMGLLLFRFAGLLVCLIMYRFIIRAGSDACLVLKSAFWFCLPSSLVLPLLFLHRTGKLACCRHSTESG